VLGAPGAILSRLSTRLASSEAMAVSIPFMPVPLEYLLAARG
jgi:hypothetical protein